MMPQAGMGSPGPNGSEEGTFSVATGQAESDEGIYLPRTRLLCPPSYRRGEGALSRGEVAGCPIVTFPHVAQVMG